MHIEKKLLKFSIIDFLLYFALLFTLLIGINFLFTLIIGNPGIFISDISWIIQILVPIIYSLIWTSGNRNGILKISECNDPQTLIEEIDASLKRKYKYKREDSTTGAYAYTKRTQWARFFNYFFRENVTIQPASDGCQIFAKKHVLSSIEMKVKYAKKG
jgi:hypothetical protein